MKSFTEKGWVTDKCEIKHPGKSGMTVKHQVGFERVIPISLIDIESFVALKITDPF